MGSVYWHKNMCQPVFLVLSRANMKTEDIRFITGMLRSSSTPISPQNKLLKR